MSQENVEVVRQMLEAFQRGDLERALSATDPDVELRMDDAAILLERKAWQGREGLSEFIEEFLEPWEDFRIEPRKLIDAGDHVVVLLDQFGRRSGSEFEVKMSVGHVYTVREGRIASWATYVDQEKALQAAGAAGVGRSNVSQPSHCQESE
jgi:uncharacterized protein